jgi:hypothetical protein
MAMVVRVVREPELKVGDEWGCPLPVKVYGFPFMDRTHIA